VLLVKENVAGRELSRSDIRRLLQQLVDVVIQFAVERQRRYITEIWYRPAAKGRGAHARRLRTGVLARPSDRAG
jgi:hypothetical protein